MFRKEYDQHRACFEAKLLDVAEGIRSPSQPLLQAMKYALSGGGKRLRPVLLLAVFHHLSGATSLRFLQGAKANHDADNERLAGESGLKSEIEYGLSSALVIEQKNEFKDGLGTKPNSEFGYSPKSCRGFETEDRSAVCSGCELRSESSSESESGLESAAVHSGQSGVTEKGLAVAELLACAVEILHTYTLVHDDLPCMDDDDFRRGQPSCHKKYGEATALLAGDSLLNLCYELLFKATQANPSIMSGVIEFSGLVGVAGLVGGQSVELELCAAGRDDACDLGAKDEGKLLEICKNKTAALFVGAAVLGGVAAGCDSEQLSILKEFAWNFGFAFQLKDDLSDMNPGSYAHTFGKERTEHLINKYSVAARFAARQLDSFFLEQLVDFEKYL